MPRLLKWNASKFFGVQQNVDRLLWPLIIYLMCFFVPISGNLHRNIFYIAVLLPFVVAIKKGFVSELFRSRIVVLTVLLAFYLTARNFFYVQGDFTEAFDYLRYFFSFVCFFVICVALFQHASLTRQIHRVATWAAFWGVCSVVYFFSNNGSYKRLELLAPSEDLIIAASVYAVVCVFVMFPRRHLPRVLAWVTGGVLLFCTALSGSRGATLALIIAIMAGHLWAGRKWILILPVLLLVGVAGSYYFNLFALDRLIEPSTGYRLVIWKQAINNMWSEGSLGGLLFGHSLLVEPTVIVGEKAFAHPHSGYVATFFCGGIVGVLLLLALFLSAGRQVLTAVRSEENALGVALWFFVLLIIATDSPNLFDKPGPVWFYFWLPMAFIAAVELRNNKLKSG